MHRLSNINTTAMTGDCLECGPAVALRLHRRATGKDTPECLAAHRARPSHTARSKFKARYGKSGPEFDVSDLDAALAVDRCQNPACGSELRLHVDHDHATGRVRGRLCGTCNSALGMLGDDLERIRGLAAYLEESSR